MSFLNLMRDRLKPKEVNDALMGVEKRTPKDYSPTEEVNTGQKWIDGKDIYMRYFSGTFSTITETTNQTLISSFDIETLIDNDLFLAFSDVSIYKMPNAISFNSSSKALFVLSITTSFSEKPFYGIVRYTKPDPVPETTKKTRKKTKK